MAEEKKKGSIKKWVTIAVIACLVIICIQNRDSVRTEILFFTLDMPRFVLLGMMLAIGFVVGFFSRGGKKEKA